VSKALTVQDQFTIFSRPADRVANVIKTNIGEGGRIGLGNLDQVKMPTGGATSWTVPDLNGEQIVKELTGIILFWKPNRAFWATEYTGKSTDPDCRSNDAIIGVGNPGGPCNLCPFAEWGSDPKGGRGQACKLSKQIFLIRPNMIMPTVINLPATSLTPLDKYMFRLMSNMLSYYEVITTIKVERVDNGNVPAYARAVFQYEAELSPEQIANVEALRGQLVPMFTNYTLQYGEVADENGDSVDEVE
jgi:hypothetical protein